MPLYNYRCSGCGNEFEALNRIADRHQAACKCSGTGKQLVSAPAVIPFKYGLFEHITDEPIFIRNKEELRSAEERYQCYAPGVRD